MTWNPNWRQAGSDPDYRFTLANERTFLAWVRTAMALLAGGVVLEQFADRLQPHAILMALAAALAALAGALCMMAYRHWRANEIAMRHGLPLPAPLALLLGGLLLIAAVIVMMGGAARRRRLMRGDVSAVSPVMTAGVVGACLASCVAALVPHLQ